MSVSREKPACDWPSFTRMVPIRAGSARTDSSSAASIFARFSLIDTIKNRSA
ncbi:hypothetical protein [Nonomuraea sp. JJY05]|uniref:hypothetical protein n=1 Tax=Nonomuraea sp. JJY05 TaxID=3350255 RepID=UPI00373E2EFE